MASTTAIELGADTCALARTAVRGGEVRLLAGEVLDPASFPGTDSFTIAVRKTRRSLKLPRRCRVVLWGLPDGANRHHAAVKPMLAPLTGAGFRVDRVVTPCNALAALARARMRRGDHATCWVAVNRGGVAIVVLRPGQLVYSHSYVWDSSIGATGSQARLLQRYSLVAFLAPEVKRALAEARKLGFAVDAVITCGNLPDLRSLTMPLIEELDIEVETLDSLDGLAVQGPAVERLTELAPAIRLACAGAIARGTRPWDAAKLHSARRAAALSRAAAVLAAAAVLLLAWYLARGFMKRSAAPALTEVSRTRPAPAPPVIAPPAQRATVPQPEAASSAPSAPPVKPSVPLVKPLPEPANPPPRTAQSTASTVTAPVAPLNPPASDRNRRPAPAAAPRETVRTDRPDTSNAAPVRNPPERSPVRQAPRTNKPPAGPPTVNARGAGADHPPVDAGRPSRPLPALLKEPLPRVTAILISNERRLATIDDGRIIGVGDVVSRRLVIGIDQGVVILREPSGVQIRLGLGGRVLSVDIGR